MNHLTLGLLVWIAIWFLGKCAAWSIKVAGRRKRKVKEEVAHGRVPSITVLALKFSGGASITLEADDIILIVGPNNAGKSATLREVQSQVLSSESGSVVTSLKLNKAGSVPQVENFLDKFYKSFKKNDHKRFSTDGHEIMAYQLDRNWNGQLGDLGHFFCVRIGTDSRLSDSNACDAIDVSSQPASHPIHLLYSDEKLEARLSSLFKQAFGQDLLVDRLGGAKVSLRVGTKEDPENGEDRLTPAYQARLKRNTLKLEKQGDGMRSFATVLLRTMVTSAPSLVLLDEPEAFLHPPQARLLGEFLARERSEGSQLFIATHSPEILHGVLNAAPRNLKLVRITRDKDGSIVKVLNQGLAEQISKDPLMRYSSVLSGVFHERVIIAESDADCMFYSSLLDLPEVHGSKHPDVLFTQAGGKDRIPALAKTLVALGVKVDVIVDIDVIQDLSNFERLVQSLGGCWESVIDDVKAIKRAIESDKVWLDNRQVCSELGAILAEARGTNEAAFPKSAIDGIKAIFKRTSPWSSVQEAGERGLPPGAPTQSFEMVTSYCRSIGIWVLPVGEIEGFCKDIRARGPRWVREVLEKYDLATSPKLQTARAFMTTVWNTEKLPR